jgi:hypothetical protein
MDASLAQLGDLQEIVQNLSLAVFVLDGRPQDILRYLATIERRADQAGALAAQLFGVVHSDKNHATNNVVVN